VTIQEVNQALADAFKLERPQGALVSQVEPGSPAARAGLKSGDVILAANGQRIVGSGDLPAVLAQMRAGDKVQLDVWRGGRTTQVTAELAGSSTARAQARAKDAPAAAAGGKLGLALRPLQPEDRPAGAKGLVVEEVSGAAARAGVQPGDVVVAVNGVPATTVEAVRGVVEKADRSVALLIQRDGQRLFVPVRVG
jgi:serine protease Do